MRRETLTGYLLHARPYQEKRAIYEFFSREHGRLQGVGVRGVPAFAMVRLFATGQHALKSFSQITPVPATHTQIRGQAQYATLYLNEIICRLVACEFPCPSLYEAYEKAVQALAKVGEDGALLRQSLREFERVLFDELGVMPDLERDTQGQRIEAQGYYRFDPNQGFIREQGAKQCFIGEVIITMRQALIQQLDAGDTDEGVTYEHLGVIGQIHRQILDNLLDHKPLNSRKLWQQSLSYRAQ